jgi:two-component system, LuxR family, sensor kinase FixL
LLPEGLRSAYGGDRGDDLSAPESRAMGTGRELFGRRKDGSEVPVEIGLNPILTSEGKSILASVLDITERRNAERERVRQRAELAHLSRVAMLGELSGSLAHELNQPLTAILSNAQAAQAFLAQEATDLDEVRGILKDIVDEDRRAREVIRRLRLLFRKGEIQFEALDLNELVLEVLKLMNSDLVNHGVKVQTDLVDALPRIKGDRVQLQQVLINLIVNASDAMSDNNGFDRTMRVTTQLEDSQAVQMSVSDAGCGIAADQIERIFEPFHTTKAKGMGLGLAVCRTIVSAHAGKLWATNNRPRGACFHATLPSIPAGAL